MRSSIWRWSCHTCSSVSNGHHVAAQASTGQGRQSAICSVFSLIPRKYDTNSWTVFEKKKENNIYTLCGKQQPFFRQLGNRESEAPLTECPRSRQRASSWRMLGAPLLRNTVGGEQWNWPVWGKPPLSIRGISNHDHGSCLKLLPYSRGAYLCPILLRSVGTERMFIGIKY